MSGRDLRATDRVQAPSGRAPARPRRLPHLRQELLLSYRHAGRQPADDLLEAQLQRWREIVKMLGNLGVARMQASIFPRTLSAAEHAMWLGGLSSAGAYKEWADSFRATADVPVAKRGRAGGTWRRAATARGGFDAAPPPGMAPPATPAHSPPSGGRSEVEDFIQKNPALDARAADALRQEAPDIQRAVIQRDDQGPLANCDNPSAILMSRIKKAKEALPFRARCGA
ncbi:unnamed protein product [Prorocentrum cordatum]|uniref:Uncharacterized protein n=1 Tax=Prorocentrum cordatum TaxID=2364126 RepID=A0ABN9TBF8_9DINO|nr:unnamed protein product [Polarella glacialis]